MKRICTLLMTSCALMFAQALHAQSVTASTTAPDPMPGFNSPIYVSAAEGFTSTSSNVTSPFTFPKAAGQTVTITSPAFFYGGDQASVYFWYQFDIAKNATSACQTTVAINFGSTTISANTSLSVTYGQNPYYFSLNLGSILPANTLFTISLTMNIPNNSDKAVTALQFATNALRGVTPVEGPVTLPVNFSNFLAQKASDGVALAWNVGQEQNVSNYQVERSTDGAHFTAIGSVVASGHPSYSFIDRQPVASAYYRIKANDKDGKYKYSSVVTIKGHQSGTVLKAFPSPVQSQLTVQHSAAQAGSSVQVFAMDGRMIESILPSSGAQQTSLNLSSAKAGVYMVKFVNGSEVESLKVVKQ